MNNIIKNHFAQKSIVGLLTLGAVFFSSCNQEDVTPTQETSTSVNRESSVENSNNQMTDMFYFQKNGFEDGKNWVNKNNSKKSIIYDYSAIEGQHYLSIEGVTNFQLCANNYSLTKDNVSPFTLVSGKEKPTDPRNVWFNVYVHGMRGTKDSLSTLKLSCIENDGHQGQFGNMGDNFSKRIGLNFEGWKLVSFRYSDFEIDKEISSGNGAYEPNKIQYTRVYLHGTEEGESVKAMIDYPCLTVGGPLDLAKAKELHKKYNK